MTAFDSYALLWGHLIFLRYSVFPIIFYSFIYKCSLDIGKITVQLIRLDEFRNMEPKAIPFVYRRLEDYNEILQMSEDFPD